MLDEYTPGMPGHRGGQKLEGGRCPGVLTKLFTRYGPPTHIRSDNGSEFTAQAVRDWLRELGVKTLFIEPGSPWRRNISSSASGAPSSTRRSTVHDYQIVPDATHGLRPATSSSSTPSTASYAEAKNLPDGLTPDHRPVHPLPLLIETELPGQ